MKLTAETLIKSDRDTVWRLSQTPHLHTRWDLRFTDIEYLPRESAAEPQRFRYATHIGFGLAVKGWGETMGDPERSTSALKFGSTDAKSIIREGTGSWTYSDQAGTVRFSTVYDYAIRHGWFGRVLDLLQWEEAETRFKRSLELSPTYPTANHWYAEYVMTMGRQGEAIATVKNGHELDPLSLIINVAVGWAFYLARRYGEAIEQLRRTIELDPNYPVTYWILYLQIDPSMDGLRDTPRFQDLSRRVSLPALMAAIPT